ncbi:MAG TPA: amidohydrolase family protein, partial [Phycisphaerales bacterium]|nr:amidohydrolase family protein [Phycisphaerales bacterium]
MSATVIRNARVLTMLAPGETRPPEGGRRGAAHGTLGILEKADVYVDSGIIVEVAPECSWSNVDHEINADGRVLMPGFVDCHTHACWAGSRLDEWERKLAGATYQEIAAAGGGIMSTVRAVRGSTGGQLGLELQSRTSRMARLGSTTIEVKSGYGLRVDYELRMLRAI